MNGTFAPLSNAPSLIVMGAVALAMIAVYALGRGRESIWPGTLLRILAVLGIIVPGMTILGWYQHLQRARDWSQQLAIRPDPIAETFMVSSVALLTAGFVLLVGGIYLARRLPHRPGQDPGGSER